MVRVSTDRARLLEYGEAVGIPASRLQYKPLRDPRTDVRRDGAYTIFYMGINLGAFLGSLLCGYLGETYGWAYGFGAAGLGMLLGLVVFVLGKPLLMGRGESRKLPIPLQQWPHASDVA